MALKDLMKKFKKEEAIEERIDPVIEQRRKEKFSSPLIYDDEEHTPKTEPQKVVKPAEKALVKRPKLDTAITPFYSMSEIISPMTGKKEELVDKLRPSVKPIKKKRVTSLKEQLVPVISPFFGAQEEQIEVDEELQTTINTKPIKEKKENKKPDSVTENLRNLANIIKEEENQLKIIEARTGEFQLDFSGVQGEEKTLIDEIDDEMTLDELMNLYEKKKLKE